MLITRLRGCARRAAVLSCRAAGRYPKRVKSSFSEAAYLGLDLEAIDRNLFRSNKLWRPAGARGVYGGTVIGQSLMAAHESLAEDLQIHSMHSYFLRPGDATRPILYKVDSLRDGRSFSARSVTAQQNGEVIFNCHASFHKPEISRIHHQDPMPHAPPPEEVPSLAEHLQEMLLNEDLSPRYRAMVTALREHPFGMDMRSITRPRMDKAPRATNEQLTWMKACSPLGDDPVVHKCVMAFASDMGLGITSLLPHEVVFPSGEVQMVASLDHSAWFHSNDFRADDWLLYQFTSPRAGDGRGLNFGRVFTQDGTLVMTCAQEAVIRLRSDRPDNE